MISCAGTGQDGELQKGAQRGFTDNGDGTITDQATGLTWEKLSDDGSIHDKDNLYSWANAFAKVATLNSAVFGGHSDWRVPNRRELESLIDASTFSPVTYSAFNSGCAASCTVLTCSCNVSSGYWSSTPTRAVRRTHGASASTAATWATALRRTTTMFVPSVAAREMELDP